jgi:hypothetical protein
VAGSKDTRSNTWPQGEQPENLQARPPASQGRDRKLRIVRKEDDLEDKPTMQDGAPRTNSDKKAGMLGRALQQRIGRILRDSFVSVEQEPLPERLNELIEELQRREKNR